MLTENFEKIYKKYSQKDYWDYSTDIKNKINQLKQLNKTSNNMKSKYTQEDVIKHFKEKEKNEAQMQYIKIETLINSGDVDALKKILRHDQKFSIECFEDITHKKLPSSTKAIGDFLDKFLNENRIELNESGFFRKELEITALDREARILPALLKKYNAGKPTYLQVKMKLQKIGKTDIKGVNLYKATIESEDMDIIDKFLYVMKNTKQALK